MKSASPATLTILSSGQYLKAELYDIVLSSGQTLRLTDFQVPVTAAIYPSITANTYVTGITIQRDTMHQKAGVEAGEMKLTLVPQPDSPVAAPTFNGYPLLQAVRYGMLDGAKVQLSKLFMNIPSAGQKFDTSPGAVGWFLGAVQQVEVDRMAAVLTVNDALAYLGAQQMPRALYQVGCFHQVYDGGCGLLKASFTVTAHVTSVTDAAHFNTSLTQADDYFDLGVMTFTSGANNGQSATVSLYKNASGAITTRIPFPATPAVNDTFTIYPGCDLQQSTCQNKFNNLVHFGGQPYIPQPETLLDGGTDNPPVQTRGSQAGQIIGSAPTGRSWRPGGYRW